MGISIPTGLQLQKFKSGLILKRDFNNPNFDNIGAGMLFDLSHIWPLWGRVQWKNSLEFKYLFPTRTDTESDLGLSAKWISSLDIGLTEHLFLSLFADSFIFQGKLPTTSQVGASFLLGVGLSYDRLWKPLYEGLF
jgi:hypothetical protein